MFQLQVVTLGFITANWKIELRFDISSHREENLKRKWLTLTNSEEQDQQGMHSGNNCDNTYKKFSIIILLFSSQAEIYKFERTQRNKFDKVYDLKVTKMSSITC